MTVKEKVLRILQKVLFGATKFLTSIQKAEPVLMGEHY